jgi:metallo-beta-lactamase family protein
MRQVISETVAAGGNIVVPTFAIERAQELLYYMNELSRQGRLPRLNVFVDSPMAIRVTEVFKRYPQLFDTAAKELLREDHDLFDFNLLKATCTPEESKSINYLKESAMILAGSGMCTGGRIKHHLVNNISKPESTILFVGYQAVGTLGRQILERPPKVRIFGKTYDVRARIEKINGFSAHADKNELLRWIKGFKHPPQKVFVIHGEDKAAEAFSRTLQSTLDSEIIVPHYQDEYEL